MTTCCGTKEFEGATFVKASFKGATLRFSDVSGVTMRSVDVDGLDIDSHDLFFGSLFVNGVDVVPLVDADSTGSSRAASCRRRGRPKACARVGSLCSPRGSAGVWIRLPPEDRLVLQQLSSRQDVGVP